jgi:nucleoid-associated protein YgaU
MANQDNSRPPLSRKDSTSPAGKGAPAGKAAPARPANDADHELQRQHEREAQAHRASDLKAAQAKVAAPQGVKHTVASGETLSHISDKYYKTPNRWREIYEANKEVIGDNPGMIKPGQVLVIPNA